MSMSSLTLRALAVLALLLAAACAVVNGWFFALGLDRLEPDAAARAPLLLAGWLMVTTEHVAVGLAALLPTTGVLAALLIAYIVGIKLCDMAGKAVGVADHGGIVWDEIVAMALVLCFSPSGLWWWVACFAVFRLFDILKPWPIRYFDERWKNGFGVMFDDLLAAGYAVLLIQLAALWI